MRESLVDDNVVGIQINKVRAILYRKKNKSMMIIMGFIDCITIIFITAVKNKTKIIIIIGALVAVVAVADCVVVNCAIVIPTKENVYEDFVFGLSFPV